MTDVAAPTAPQQRLRAVGKKPKAALTAVMRKLILVQNSAFTLRTAPGESPQMFPPNPQPLRQNATQKTS